MTDTVRTYELDDDVAGLLHHSLLGAVEFAFPAGTVRPANDVEELCLEQLVDQGRATATGARRAIAFDAPEAVDEDQADAKPKRKRKPRGASAEPEVGPTGPEGTPAGPIGAVGAGDDIEQERNA